MKKNNNQLLVIKDSPFIFIMLPTFNRPDLVIRSVNSVIQQKNNNYRLFIFNDGSTKDYSELETLVKNNKNILYQKSDVNIGINKSRNLMIDYCIHNFGLNNIYFCTLSDDDFFLPDALTVIAEEIEKNPEQRWLCFNCESMSQSIFKNTCYEDYSELSYSRFVADYFGDKHFLFKLSSLGEVRYPHKYFKNGYEHIFYYKFPSNILTIPRSVKVVEYQEDGLSLGPLYNSKKSILTIIKHILSSPKELVYYRWLLKAVNPKKVVKKLITEEQYYRIKKLLGLKVTPRSKGK